MFFNINESGTYSNHLSTESTDFTEPFSFDHNRTNYVYVENFQSNHVKSDNILKMLKIFWKVKNQFILD